MREKSGECDVRWEYKGYPFHSIVLYLTRTCRYLVIPAFLPSFSLPQLTENTSAIRQCRSTTFYSHYMERQKTAVHNTKGRLNPNHPPIPQQQPVPYTLVPIAAVLHAVRGDPSSPVPPCDLLPFPLLLELWEQVPCACSPPSG